MRCKIPLLFMMLVMATLFLGLVVSGCKASDEHIASEAAQESSWRLVEKELVDQTPSAELRKTWKELRIPRFILESRRRLAALKKEKFDLKKHMSELGIKRTAPARTDE